MRTWRWLVSLGKPTLGLWAQMPSGSSMQTHEAMKMQTRTSEKPFVKGSHTDLPYSSSNPHNPVSRYSVCLPYLTLLKDENLLHTAARCTPCQLNSINRVEPIKGLWFEERESVFPPPCDLGRLMQLELFHSPLRSLCWPRDLWANNTESIIITME